jgi:hypothetical protein
MVLEVSITPGFLEPFDPFDALRRFNWGVEGVNEVRTAVGCDALEIRAGGFKTRLVANEFNGWK